MKQLILLLTILLLPVVLAECPSNTTILNRVLSDCRINNSICDDGENLFINPDCTINQDDFSQGRIFTYMWLVRLLIIITIILAITKNPNWIIPVILIVILLFFNQSNSAPKPADINETISQQSLNCAGTNFVAHAGDCIWPSRPTVGWIIIVGLGLLLLNRWLNAFVYKYKKY